MRFVKGLANYMKYWHMFPTWFTYVLTMLKGGWAIMGLKTYEKEATQNKHVKVEKKQTRI